MSSTNYTAASPPFDEDSPPRHTSSAPRVWAGAILLLTGLGLVGLGGCFLIGAEVIANPAFFNPSPPPGPPPLPSWEPVNVFLFVVLNVLAVACVLGAVTTFVAGFLGLVRILFGATRETA